MSQLQPRHPGSYHNFDDRSPAEGGIVVEDVASPQLPGATTSSPFEDARDETSPPTHASSPTTPVPPTTTQNNSPTKSTQSSGRDEQAALVHPAASNQSAASPMVDYAEVFRSADGSPPVLADGARRQGDIVLHSSETGSHSDFPVDGGAAARRALPRSFNIPDDSDDDGEHDEEDRDGEFGQHETLQEIYDKITSHEFSCRQRCYHVIHGNPVLSPDDIIGLSYNTILFLAIAMSTLTFMIESEPAFYDPSGPQGVFFTLEAISVAIFTLDLVLRFVTATRLKHVLNLQTFFDFASIIGFYINLPFRSLGRTIPPGILLPLRLIRLTRVLRMLKISKAAQGMNLLMQTVLKSKQGLFLLVILVAIAVLFGAAIIHWIELQYSYWYPPERKWYREDGEPSPYQSIPGSFWFMMATLSTIGYGDAYPLSIAGRAATVGFMLMGVLLLSFPNILIGAQFQEVHHAWARSNARRALGVRFRRVRMIVRFIRMWREFRVHGAIKSMAGNYNMSKSFGAGGILKAQQSVYLDDGLSKSRTFSPDKKKRFLGPQRTTNFFYRCTDFVDYDYTESELLLSSGHLDEFNVGALSALALLQRLLVGFSTVATADELFQSYIVFSRFAVDPTGAESSTRKKSEIVEMFCHLANARIIDLYVCSRVDEVYIAALTRFGMQVLQVFVEPQDEMPTIRCFEEAMEIWQRTTKKQPNIILPVDGYRNWQEEQEMVPKRDVTTFTYDAKLPQAKNNDIFAADFVKTAKAVTSATNLLAERRSTTVGSSTAGPQHSRADDDGSNNDDSGSSRHRQQQQRQVGCCPFCSHCCARTANGSALDTLALRGSAANTVQALRSEEQFLEQQLLLVQSSLEMVKLMKALQLQRAGGGGDGDAGNECSSSNAASHATAINAPPTSDGANSGGQQPPHHLGVSGSSSGDRPRMHVHVRRKASNVGEQ